MKKYFYIFIVISTLLFNSSVAVAQYRPPTEEELRRAQFTIFSTDEGVGVCTGAPVNYSSLADLVGDTASQRISELEETYLEIERDYNFPWELIAALHYREVTNQYLENPSNGQGVFQLYTLYQQGERFPAGPIDLEEFKRQAGLAIEFLRTKKSANYSVNERDLTLAVRNDDALIKDYLYSYNGRAEYARTEAIRYGFDGNSQAYEGASYVMNRFDVERQNMKQDTQDGPGQDIKEETRPGAFTIYNLLRGQNGSGTIASLDDDPRVINDANGTLSAQAYRGAQEARRLGHEADILGVAGRAANPGSDHPRGYAIDVMAINAGEKASGSDKNLLDRIAQHFLSNREALSVKYVIWYGEIASSRNSYAWRPYSHPSGATDNTSLHFDHIHISFNDTSGGGIINDTCVGG